MTSTAPRPPSPVASGSRARSATSVRLAGAAAAASGSLPAGLALSAVVAQQRVAFLDRRNPAPLDRAGGRRGGEVDRPAAVPPPAPAPARRGRARSRRPASARAAARSGSCRDSQRPQPLVVGPAGGSQRARRRGQGPPSAPARAVALRALVGERVEQAEHERRRVAAAGSGRCSAATCSGRSRSPSSPRGGPRAPAPAGHALHVQMPAVMCSDGSVGSPPAHHGAVPGPSAPASENGSAPPSSAIVVGEPVAQPAGSARRRPGAGLRRLLGQLREHSQAPRRRRPADCRRRAGRVRGRSRSRRRDCDRRRARVSTPSTAPARPSSSSRRRRSSRRVAWREEGVCVSRCRSCARSCAARAPAGLERFGPLAPAAPPPSPAPSRPRARCRRAEGAASRSTSAVNSGGPSTSNSQRIEAT